MLSITLSEPGDLASLGERWQNLQARASPSFFQSWTWVGCLARERFADPVLLEARQDGETMALALFNRRRPWFGAERLWLGESGIAALDSIFVEHNGPLIAREWQVRLIAPCLRAALGMPVGGGRGRARRHVVLSGVDDAQFGEVAGSGLLVREQTRSAPFVDLAAIRGRGGCYLASLSANTRYQLRRSGRAYEAAGPIAVRRAETVAEARDTLDALACLHQASWTRRGRPGAFATSGFVRFHHALIARGVPTGEVDLLRVTAGEVVIGYLYNFRFGGVVAAYQSGFDYAAAGPHQKPGLTCHHRAIEMYAAEGVDRYDFLAGGDRYKTSLANAATRLHWVELAPRRSLGALMKSLRGLWRRTNKPADEVPPGMIR
jgi:CelD/BcsL family acetyltransferase involved in cellulose biosynthesis